MIHEPECMHYITSAVASCWNKLNTGHGGPCRKQLCWTHQSLAYPSYMFDVRQPLKMPNTAVCTNTPTTTKTLSISPSTSYPRLAWSTDTTPRVAQGATWYAPIFTMAPRFWLLVPQSTHRPLLVCRRQDHQDREAVVHTGGDCCHIRSKQFDKILTEVHYQDIISNQVLNSSTTDRYSIDMASSHDRSSRDEYNSWSFLFHLPKTGWSLFEYSMISVDEMQHRVHCDLICWCESRYLVSPWLQQAGSARADERVRTIIHHMYTDTGKVERKNERRAWKYM